MSRLCPGPYSERCCVRPDGVDALDRHLNAEEGGIYLEGCETQAAAVSVVVVVVVVAVVVVVVCCCCCCSRCHY